MNFATFTFFWFLTLVFIAYWAIRRRSWQNVLLLVASYAFYSWWDWRFTWLMLTSSLIDYIAARAIASARARAQLNLGNRNTTRSGRPWLILSLIANLGLLGTFKYFNFFSTQFAHMLHSIGIEASNVTLDVVLPVGISFYTFQTMSYTIDVYRGDTRPTKSVLSYFTYVAFFPQLVAGPIERASRLLPQFDAPRRFSNEQVSEGGRLLLLGLAKKMIIADNIGRWIDTVYSLPSRYSGWDLAVASTLFGMQIYCDFSGYSDIARGTGKMLGIDLMLNFRSPYLSRSPAEFWKRWHISLSTWFRDYIYIPLGGSHGSRWRTAFNVMVTFLVSGFWHGANWTFIAWGFVHGLAVIPQVVFRKSKKERPPRVWALRFVLGLLATIATFVFVTSAWVFFRSATISEAWVILTRVYGDLVTLGDYTQGSIGRKFPWMDRIGIITWIAIWLLLPFEWIQRKRAHLLDIQLVGPAWISRCVRWIVYTVLIWSILYTIPQGIAPFIYFQF